MKRFNLSKKGIQTISIFSICFINIYLIYSSEYKFAFFCGITFFVSIGCLISGKREKIIYMFAILGALSAGYNLYTAKDTILQNAVTFSLINTQSCWYNEGNPFHRDVLLHTFLKNKVAILPSKDVWYYKYIEIFSGQIEVDKEVNRVSRKHNSYENIGAIRMRSLKDLIPDDIYRILDERVSNGDYQYLFADIESLYSVNKIVVLSDKEFNIYLKAYEN